MTADRAPRTLCEAFQATALRHPDAPALRTPDGSVTVNWRHYAERVRAIAAGLAGLGVRHGDTVALMLTNRPEFHLVDTAALHAGAIPFSIYNTLAPEQIAHVFGNAGNRVVICEQQFVPALLEANAAGRVEHIVCVDGNPAATITLAQLEAEPAPDFDFDASWRAVTPQDVLTIIYTSGTTGPSKGVELTHANMLAEIDGVRDVAAVDHTDSLISYLPDAHVANRWGAHYTNLVLGVQIVTLADVRQAVTVLPQVRPTFFGAVPQVWYKLKAAIEHALEVEPSPVKRRLAAWAIGVGRRKVRMESDGKPVPAGLGARYRLADALVLRAVRAKLGMDRVRFAVSGAAAISEDALEFVLALGIPCCEGWGMSEVSALATLNPIDAIRIGTVGKAVKGAELRIADDGELLVRGALVMKGYRHDPDKTAETIDPDGWLHTGDIASIDDDGYVRIVDRKKELIINAAGKNMSPANIEGVLQVSCPLLGPVAVIGDDRPYLVALLTLDPDGLAAYAARTGASDACAAALAGDPGLRALVEAGVKAANERLSRVEQIKRFAILPEMWEPGGEQLTPTMKLRRRPIAQRYAAEIDALYAAPR
jgi:long-chain acyl-CoA synthetase